MDYLVRGLAANQTVRAVAVNLTNTVQEAQQRHNSFPTATAALGRLLVAVAAMGSTLKDNQSITIQVIGDGPLGTIVADGNWLGHLRGYVRNPQIQILPQAKAKLDVGAGVGNSGMLYVIKDLGLKDPYRGSSPIVSGEIAEDITYYFAQSEQTPTVFAAGVLVNPDLSVQCAGGYLLQLMPGASESVISELEAGISNIPSATSMISDNYSPEDMLSKLLGGLDLKILPQRQELKYQCTCNKKRLEKVLLSLGQGELQSLVSDGQAELVCHFCNHKYIFTGSELKLLLKKA